MAQRGSYALNPQLDIEQLQLEAQHRWLRPAEICEILRNYQKFQISSEPPNRPPSGSLFLFDRKVLRYFRKDGHNWRKKKDGKTVKEAHEKLKVGSVDVLHCYYAHGEENENFQRRSYWMLEHPRIGRDHAYWPTRFAKGNRTNVDSLREHDNASSLNRSSPLSYSFTANQSTTPSGNTDTTSPTSTLSQLCEDADSGDIRQMGSGFPLMESLHQRGAPGMDKLDAASFSNRISDPKGNLGDHHTNPGVAFASSVDINGPRSTVGGISSQKSLGLATWEDILRQSMAGSEGFPSSSSTSSGQTAPTGNLGQENLFINGLLGGETALIQTVSSAPVPAQWQRNYEDGSLLTPAWSVDPALDLDLTYEPHSGLLEQIKYDMDSQINFEQPGVLYGQANQQWERHGLGSFSSAEVPVSTDGDAKYSFPARRLLKDGEESLKKVDSFSRWVSKELGEVESLQMQSSSGLSWSTVECENVDESSLSPSISQDQLFSIADFSPKWAYADSNIEVLIVGTFLKNPRDVAQCNWSCMFGEVEVPTQVLGNGLLSCQVPGHSVGQVPFYVTCSNRLACSEVREFTYRAGSANVDIKDFYGVYTNEIHFHVRLDKLLSLSSVRHFDISNEDLFEKRKIINKIITLKEEDDNLQMLEAAPETSFQTLMNEQALRTVTKEKLYSWLLHKVVEDGKGPCVLDEQGQGVLHLVVALGYDWAIRPILAAGVSINFRDANGWTALHWAAFCGREKTVASLLSLGASPGLPSDPTPQFPLGQMPFDLASINGHKGISGFLAESSLTGYLKVLNVTEANEAASEISASKAVQTLSERSATPFSLGDAPEALSLKDSLDAVCNATQAADRIHQIFRIQSFQRKQLEIGDESELDQRALSLAAARNRRASASVGLAHTAAIQIQKKFRGWKKRKEFLTIRQRIVKIQAQWRGHQVRKQYRTIIWSVGILEKIILRWRRRGSGLRGFKSDAVTKEPVQPALPQKVVEVEDDYDFLKKGRKQTEERLQKALTRVKSMVRYPEARDQYRRILTVCEGLREKKGSEMVLNSTEVVEGEDDMIDIDCLLDDDAIMSMTFE